MTDNNLIRNIISFRKDRNWSQIELARRLELSNIQVNKIENGKRNVSSEELQKLAEVFNVSMESLMGNYDINENAKNELYWKNLGLSFGGLVPSDLKDMYRVIAEEYIRKHPEVLNNNS